MRRDDKNSLGISIVGGKVDLSWSGSSVTGIFIKNVLPDSPAGKGGHLKVGNNLTFIFPLIMNANVIYFYLGA